RQHPRQRLQDGAQRIDAIESRLLRAANSQFDTARERHDQLRARLQRASPAPLLQQWQSQQASLRRRLQQAMAQTLTQSRQRLHSSVRALHTASPLQTLERGYAIARDDNDNVLTDAGKSSPGDAISVVL